MNRSPASPASARNARSRRPAGFSFIEILVVMGIIAVLAGLAVVVMQIVAKKAPEIKTRTLIQRVRATIDQFHMQMKSYPPTNIIRIASIGIPLTIGKAPNTTNEGIESAFICMHLPGFDHKADLSDAETCNTDADSLDKPVPGLPDAHLFEVKDAWGNPLVYIPDADYVDAEKNGVVYICGTGPEGGEVGDAKTAKPWRLSSGGFAQPGTYQLFSMGPDGEPNTEDDLKSWE